MHLFKRATGVLVALFGALILSAVWTPPAEAQPLDPAASPGASSSSAATPPTAGRRGYIALDNFGIDNPDDLASNDPARRDNPRSLTRPAPALPSTISGATPIVDWSQCVNRFGQRSCTEVWDPIARDNQGLCTLAAQAMKDLAALQLSFGTDEEDLKFLQSVYEDLSPELKRSTRIMQGAQAVQAGFLCVLSAGSYCIAAVAGAAGNITVANSNLKLQLANVKLSIVNILVTRKNIRLQSIHVELTGQWIPKFAPLCVNMGYITADDIIATRRTAMAPIETLDSPVLQRDRERYRERGTRRERRGWF